MGRNVDQKIEHFFRSLFFFYASEFPSHLAFSLFLVENLPQELFADAFYSLATDLPLNKHFKGYWVLMATLLGQTLGSHASTIYLLCSFFF